MNVAILGGLYRKFSLKFYSSRALKKVGEFLICQVNICGKGEKRRNLN